MKLTTITLAPLHSFIPVVSKSLHRVLQRVIRIPYFGKQLCSTLAHFIGMISAREIPESGLQLTLISVYVGLQ